VKTAKRPFLGLLTNGRQQGNIPRLDVNIHLPERKQAENPYEDSLSDQSKRKDARCIVVYDSGHAAQPYCNKPTRR
jgi:hypothetical protein